jgi:hypothetical protein
VAFSILRLLLTFQQVHKRALHNYSSETTDQLQPATFLSSSTWKLLPIKIHNLWPSWSPGRLTVHVLILQYARPKIQRIDHIVYCFLEIDSKRSRVNRGVREGLLSSAHFRRFKELQAGNGCRQMMFVVASGSGKMFHVCTKDFW